MSHNFTVGGVAFVQSALKLREALAVEAVLVQTLFPAGAAFGAGAGRVDVAGFKSALIGLGPALQGLVDTFAAVCTVDWLGKQVPLANFLDETFDRKNAMLLAWLATCIEWQFADFFDGTGLPLLTEMGKRYMSLIGSTGESGASQPTAT